MAERKNIYIGQYKAKKGLDGTFDSYWQKYGSDIKDESVKSLMQAIFDLFNQDIKKGLKSQGYNQAIFDLVEMRDLQKILKKVLEQYSQVEGSDFKYTTDVVRKRLRDSILEQLKSALSKSKASTKKDSNGEEPEGQEEDGRIQEKLEQILDEFFEKKREESEDAKKDQYTGKEVLDNFVKKLKEDQEKSGDQIKKQSEGFLSKIKSDISQRINKKLAKIKSFDGLFSKRIAKYKKSMSPFGKKNKSSFDFFGKAAFKIEQYINKKEKEKKKRFKKKIERGFKNLKKSIKMAFAFIFGLFKKIFTPVGNMITGMWNAVRHPIKTLQKFLKSGLFSFITEAFLIPATAYSLGFVLGFIYYRVVEKPLLRFVVNPILRLVKFINQQILNFQENGEPPFISKIKELFKSLVDFFTPVDGLLYPLGILYNIAKGIGFVGLEALKGVFELISHKGGAFYSALKNIIVNGMFSHFRGAGLIQKLIMLAMSAGGEMQSRLVKEGDKDYHFEAADELKGKGLGKEQIQQSGLSNEDKERALEDYELVYAEMKQTLPHLEQFYNNLSASGDALSLEDIQPFFNSPMYSEEALREQFDDILGGRNFENLEESEKYKVLQELLFRRSRTGHIKEAIYSSGPEEVTQLVPQIGFDNNLFFGEVPKVHVQKYTSATRMVSRLGTDYGWTSGLEYTILSPEGKPIPSGFQELEGRQIDLYEHIREGNFRDKTILYGSASEQPEIRKDSVPASTFRDVIQKYRVKPKTGTKTSQFFMRKGQNLPGYQPEFEQELYVEQLDEGQVEIADAVRNEIKLDSIGLHLQSNSRYLAQISSNNNTIETLLNMADGLQYEVSSVVVVYEHEDEGNGLI